MKKLLALILVFIMIFLSGCWDTRELNELGLVMAVGIDRKKGEKYFTVTVQIAKPSSAAGQGGKSGGGGDAVWVGSARGKTIFEAVRNIAKSSSRRVMWAHNNIIIIGESLAEQDISPVIDFFTQNHELRMKTWVAIAHGEARSYVAAKTGIENIPGISLAELFRYHELPAESVATDMVRFFRDYKSETTQPLVSALTMQDEEESASGSSGKQVELEGAAVFKGTKMVGWTSPEETRGLAWLRNEMQNSIIVVSGFESEEQKISVELKDTKIKMKANVEGEIPSVIINISATGDIAEIDFPSDMDIEELKAEVETKAVHEIKREIKLGLDKVQKEYKSDVLNFGRVVHIADKHEWYKRLDQKWEEIYPQVPYTINVFLEIDSAATYQEPLKYDNRKSMEE
jgi:spore germination protein KC